jgi:hypothetical protein
VLLYFKGLSLRAVREFLLHKGYEVSIEAFREWYHAVGKALQAIYTIAVLVCVDETKVKVRIGLITCGLRWTRKVCLCLCIFQEEGTLGLLSWFFTTQRQRYASLTRDLRLLGRGMW